MKVSNTYRVAFFIYGKYVDMLLEVYLFTVVPLEVVESQNPIAT